MIRTMSNAAIHFGGGIAMGVLGVFAAAGMLGMMMGGRSSLMDNGRSSMASRDRSTMRGNSSPPFTSTATGSYDAKPTDTL